MESKPDVKAELGRRVVRKSTFAGVASKISALLIVMLVHQQPVAYAEESSVLEIRSKVWFDHGEYID